jgi:hypothetical protein
MKNIKYIASFAVAVLFSSCSLENDLIDLNTLQKLSNFNLTTITQDNTGNVFTKGELSSSSIYFGDGTAFQFL